MLRRPIAALVAALSLIGGAVTVASATAAATGSNAAAPAAVSDTYSWKNVQIGGGGFVPGIIFNQSEKNLAYARTDIGGAYRWNESAKSWTPLLDSAGWTDWNKNGVVSLATDALAPDKVYAAVGMYTNSWDPSNGSILRSSDRGATWTATALPFKLGGNMPGRGMGERLAIDPNKDSVLYFAAPSGNGLWRSTDSGVTWAKVTSFPNVGNYVADPSDSTGYQSDNQGDVWVTFDPRSGTKGSTTQTVYVGVADKANTVYRSTDGGATWSRLAGQPTGYIAHKGVLDSVNGYLYIATSDTGGPYDGAKGQVWRYATATGTWTNISPMSDADTYFGYSGLTVDRQHPGTVMVTGYSSWWADTQIFRSTNSGAAWTRAWDTPSYPTRSDRYTMDVSASPWLSWGANPAPPEETPKLGWMTESLEIDPFNSNRMWYGTGATVYGTDNLTNWDTGTKFTVKPNAKGLEETSVQDLISPPSGAPLISALGDIGGFRHTSLTTVPPMMFTQPNFTTTTSLDFAAANPNTVVRVGNEDTGAHVAFSTDNGANWFAGTDPAGATGGTVAAAADGSGFLWSTAGVGVQHTTGFGNSWSTSSGIPTGAAIGSDRVNPKKFYGLYAGRFYASTDGGASFTATAATGLPNDNLKLKALPGTEGDVWVAGGSGSTYGLWHSTNSGVSFTKLSNVQEADNIGFGKAAPGASYQALYTSAKIGGVRGIFRSTDAGANWVRINDNAHQYGVTNTAITGDPRVYGRVYVATNGRGIIYGDTSDSSGGGTTPPTTTPRTTPPTTSTTSPPTTAPTTTPPTTGPTGGTCTVGYAITNQWPGGFQVSVTVNNTSSSAVNDWKLGWSFTAGETISSLWSANYTQSGAAVAVTAPSWATSIPAGGNAVFGFGGVASGTPAVPAAFTLNGVTCKKV